MLKTIISQDVFGSNCYILTRFDQCLIIDPGSSVGQIKEIIAGYNCIGIFLTHGHLDHIDAIGEFELPIYIHVDDATFLKDSRLSGYDFFKRRPSYNPNTLDIRAFYHDAKIPFADQVITVYHTPGHTRGSVCFAYRDQLFTGDTLFQHGVGRYDLPTGSLQNLRRSVMNIIKDYPSNTRIYPGHGPSSTLGDERRNNPYILMWNK